MTKPVRVDRRELRLETSLDGNPTVDVFFDGHRVWSAKLPDAHPRTGVRHVAWPKAMVPYLSGTSAITVRHSATGEDLASGEVRFGGSGRVTITDAQNRWLAMNKWNRLGPSFEGDASGMRERMVASAVALADRMQHWGYPLYIVGGTLLGAMRSGELLPHDDDLDFAVLCDKSDPQDVALASFELERRLEAAGYTVVRHSHAHLELLFFSTEGSIDYYIDIFVGYHSDDGLYNQPFALRGELPAEKLVPPSTIEVSGVSLPAPAVPEAWLEFAFGPRWLVPDPSFHWDTPRSTLRRFENVFGVFNRQRVFWEKTWQAVDKREPLDEDDWTDTDRFIAMLPQSAFVIDLGCGDGRHTERIAAAGHQVLGVDYSHEALRVARQTQPENVAYQFLNLNDRHSLLQFSMGLVDAGRQPFFFARNVLHVMRPLGRSDLFVMLRGTLDAETFLYATFDTVRSVRVPEDPRTWSLTVRILRRETHRWGLGTTVLDRRRRDTPVGPRNNLAVMIWR